MEISRVKEAETRNKFEGPEYIKKYFLTENINFCVSFLHPGQRSDLDVGHKVAHEICYVIEGIVAMHFPSEERVLELRSGDAILIPPQISHAIVNIGTVQAKMIFCAAPGTEFSMPK